MNTLLDHKSGLNGGDKKLPSSSASAGLKSVSSSSVSVSSSSKSVSSSSATGCAMAVSSSSSEELCVSTMKLSKEEDDIPDSMVPVEVGFPCYDVLLLHSEEEPKNAWEIKEHLETEFRLSNGDRIQVLLYEELVEMFRRQIGCLKEGMDHCTFVFILITKTFCESDLSRFLGEECLIKSIHDANKRWSVVPLFTQPKRSADYCIPTGLNCLKGISYHTRDEFYHSNMIKMIEQRRYVKNDREKKRLKRIKEWKENKSHELHMERLKEKQREKQAEEMRKMQLQQLEESLEKESVNQSLISDSAQGHLAMMPPNYQMPHPAYSCKNPNFEQFGNFSPSQYPWPLSHGYLQYAFRQPIQMTMSYPSLRQPWGGQGMLPGYEGVTESHSIPGNMAQMAGYYGSAQGSGHPMTSGAPPPPYYMHGPEGRAQEQVSFRRGPLATEQTDASLDSQKLPTKEEGTGHGTDSAQFSIGDPQVDRYSDPKTRSGDKTKASLPEEQSFDAVTYLQETGLDPQRVTRTNRDYHQGSGAHSSGAHREAGFCASNQDEASSFSAQPQASARSGVREHGGGAVAQCEGPFSASLDMPPLDSSVEEDAMKQIEETSVKQHPDILTSRESSSPQGHGSPPATDSGYASRSRPSSKVSTASYIQQSLGVSTSTKQQDPQRSRSKADPLSSSFTGESDSLGAAWLTELSAEPRDQQFAGRTEQSSLKLREIHHHHHHHHDSEAKKVIIIQNCEQVHVGDRSTLQNIQHDAAQYQTGHLGRDDR